MNSLTPDSKTLNGQNTHTGKEILGQPDLWRETYEKVKSRQKELNGFFNKHNIHPDRDITVILTGAGSSAFIGEIAQFSFKKAGYKNARAIPTTNLVTHFTDWVDTAKPLLVVSFARSGNSPESEAVFDLANKFCDKVSHLIISCNKKGKLAQKAGSDSTFVFILPPKAEDKGLAMTGSFSGMVLAAMLISNLSDLKQYDSLITDITQIGNRIFHENLPLLKDIASKDFRRIIFLGDGPILGCAREAHLKVQELSDGLCVAKFDSFLGFRHGPKAVIDDKTQIVYYLSNQEKVMRYQIDLIEQIAEEKIGMHTLAIGSTKKINDLVDSHIYLPETVNLPENFLALPYIIVAQIIGFVKSQNLALNPDNPSRNGAISRVVKGVTIY